MQLQFGNAKQALGTGRVWISETRKFVRPPRSSPSSSSGFAVQRMDKDNSKTGGDHVSASLEKALCDPKVLNTISQAWKKTKDNKIEHGGWIYWDENKKTYNANEKTSNFEAGIYLTISKDLEDVKAKGPILADFHCHPGIHKNAGRPSDGDISGAKDLGYSRLVFTPTTKFYSYNGISALKAPEKILEITGCKDVLMWIIP